MALSDFFGTYQVRTSAGTQFGLGTVVTVEYSEDPEGGVGVISVKFEVPNQIPRTFEAQYDDTTEVLSLALQTPALEMFISRFVDPLTDYQALYGIVLMDETLPGLAVWGAERVVQEAVDPGGATTAPVDLGEFAGVYRVRSTAGAQFGVLSEITIPAPGSGGEMALSITNALGQPISDLPSLTFDPGTRSLHGYTTVPVGGNALPITIQLSLCQTTDTAGNPVKYLYGMSTIGDPQQAGVWGGDSQGGGPPAPTAGPGR